MDREELIEQAAGAWRPRTLSGNIRPHPAWHVLDESGRSEAHDVAFELRQIEAALDADGLSSTGRAVLTIVRGG